LRDLPEGVTAWRDYKAVRLQGIYYGGFYQDNDSLIDYVNAQRQITPLVCLGDGHAGVWNLFARIATDAARCAILDWYHLKENLYKVGGSLKRIRLAESHLWQGKVTAASGLFDHSKRPQAANFPRHISTSTASGL
jgi:hypothetical protein